MKVTNSLGIKVPKVEGHSIWLEQSLVLRISDSTDPTKWIEIKMPIDLGIKLGINTTMVARPYLEEDEERLLIEFMRLESTCATASQTEEGDSEPCIVQDSVPQQGMSEAP